MNQPSEKEPTLQQDPRKEELTAHYQNLAQKLISGQITPRKFAEESSTKQLELESLAVRTGKAAITAMDEELRTPMTVIGGYVDFLQADKGKAEQLEPLLPETVGKINEVLERYSNAAQQGNIHISPLKPGGMVLGEVLTIHPQSEARLGNG